MSIKKSCGKIVAILIAMTAMTLSYFKMGIFFETNDDRIIAETLAGAITQIPSPYTQVTNYFLSAPLAGLYRITGAVIPWWGTCLILFHIISYTVIFESIFSICRKKYELVLGMGICCIIFLINLYSVGLIQWTSTAALLATAGYTCLILKYDNNSVFIYAGLELLSFFLRDEAMLMIQPLGAAVLLGLFWSEGRWKEKNQREVILKWIIVTVGVLIIGTTSRWVTYHSDEWKKADAYYDARVTLMDYYGMPSYEEVQDILDKYQITQTEYEGFFNWLMIGSNIDAECLMELVAYTEKNYHADVKFRELLQSSVENILKEDSLACNRLAGLVWVCVLLWMLFAGRKELALPALGLAMARTAVWCYIIHRGRLPHRVTFPLYFAEIVLMLAMVLKTYAGIHVKTNWHRSLVLCICVFVALFGYKIGQRQYRYVAMINEAQSIYILGYDEIKEYCRQNPEKKYVLDAFSFSFYKGSALETSIYWPANGIYSGTWIGQSPESKRYEREYLGEDLKDIYLIVYDDGQPKEVQEDNISVRYFAEKTDEQPVLYDRITVSHGGSYLIWYFGGVDFD